MSPLLEVHKLSRFFGGLRAVNDLSFTVSSGEIFGIIGPNGAGKSTAVNLVSGVTKPTSGKVRFQGADVTGQPPHKLVQYGLARTFQSTTVFGNCTVEENCRRGSYLARYPGFFHSFFSTAKAGEMRQASDSRVAEVLEWLDLNRVRNVRAADLPYGAQKTLGMAISLMAWPKLLMLDEPVAGLSAAEADNVRDTIRKIRAEGISVVVIDHNMRFMAGLCDRILVLHHGQELAHGLPQDVLSNQSVIEAYLGRRHVKT
ncbi:ABC transporter ATP-binding protein [Microvirga sp. KLBC 81]|uniref:ABC transporter ATP-binding protein n=1 Tax=Microvirga sp. KLBC 81 TaxID=1862707 RepID=UPI000D51E1D8|nr:ABC transporter ATP-binding protein [Microvirga sp. KLBC 81]PVE22183.1 ABC transporter ATP-binding protein [Microvirga sp. KLBC 81]